MSNSLHNDEFEAYLHKQVGNHRMYPADQIWRNIQKELHGDGKWPALTYISIFIITALSVCTLMVKPEERLHKNTIVYPAQKEETGFNKEMQNGKNAISSAPVQYAYTDKITQQTMQSVSNIIIEREEKQNSLQPLAITKESLLLVQDKAVHEANNTSELTTAKATGKQEVLQAAATLVLPESKTVAINTQYAIAKPASRYINALGLVNPADLKKPSDNLSTTYNDDDIWRSYALLGAKDLIIKNLSKLNFQFYVTPSVSYRSLNNANGKAAQPYTAFPRAANYQLDINHLVKDRPAMGAEVGFALGYKISNSVTVKGGFQFNARQYNIKAYMLPIPTPTADATSGNNNGGTLPDEQTMSNNSYLTSASGSSGGGQPVVLFNRYYEIAAPIGIDWRIATSGNGLFTVNAAVSVQPTYTFDKQPFVVTNDYKNYTDGASIMRNWNLNSNAEAYISYRIGTFRWQLGPQFRYQHFSTYSNAYPIREHLLDYGIKLGFTKSLD